MTENQERACAELETYKEHKSKIRVLELKRQTALDDAGIKSAWPDVEVVKLRFKSLSIIEKYEYIEDVTSGAIEPDITDAIKALKWLYKEYMRVLDENYSTRTTQGEICYE